MRLAWLVLAVSTVFVGNAVADRIGCECPARQVLPERGATGVPTNARIWRLAESGDVHRAAPAAERDLLGLEVLTRPLAPNTEIRDDALGIAFTTGAGRDDTPPEAPRDVTVSFTTADAGSYSPVTSLLLLGGFGRDTALVRLDIHDGDGVLSMVTPRNRLFLCEPSLRLASRRVDVDVRALDLAGNASAPVRVHAYVEAAAEDAPRCRPRVDEQRDYVAYPDHHHACGGGLAILIVLLYPLGLLAWLAVALVRRALIGRQLAEPLSMLHAEAVVRRLTRRQYVWTSLVIAAVIATVAKLDEGVAILFAPWAISAVAQLLMLRRASSLLERPEADAARRGRWLVVTSLTSSIAVRASDRAFVAGKREAIPRSVAK